jgi:hypothetical protein
VLQQRVFNAVEELPEANQQVALGYQQVHREAHIEVALDQIELLGQAAGLLGDGVRRVLNQAFDREDEEQAVDGAQRASPLEQAQELTPFRGLAGPGFVEEHGTGGVEDDAAVGEPPVHVHRPA